MLRVTVILNHSFILRLYRVGLKLKKAGARVSSDFFMFTTSPLFVQSFLLLVFMIIINVVRNNLYLRV